MKSPSPRHPLRVGIVGAGAIAQVVHLPCYLRLPNVQVTALCDLDPTKLRLLSAKYGIPRAFRDYEALLASPEVDAVDVCLPNNLHHRVVLAALAAGKHVLCEKPLALRSDEVREILEAQAASGRKVLVGMNNRFRHDSILLKRFVEEGGLGDPFFIKTGWLKRRTRIHPSRWRYRKDVAGGGVFMDLGIQVLDLALWLADYPALDRLAARFVHGTPDVDVEDSAFVFLQGGELTVTVEVSWSYPLDQDFNYLSVFGTRGSGHLSPLRLFESAAGGGVRDRTPPYVRSARSLYLESYQREIAYFVEVVAGREEPPPLDEQLRLVRLLEEIEVASGEMEMVRPEEEPARPGA
ncbi:MAG: Gfo/Idh/MocA family protein [Gemmatimonadota bacterium]